MKCKTFIRGGLLLLLLPCLSGCGGAEEKEKVTIYLRNYADHKGVYSEDEEGADYDSMTRYMADQFVAQYDKYDVTVETEYFALEDEPKFVERKYGQPDATDIVFQDGFVNLGHAYEGRLVPLDGLIPEAVKEDVGKEFKDLYMMDDRLYMAPFGRLPTVFLYNAELFKEAGLEEYIAEKDEIADWSVEEWDTILSALLTKLPENVYPMMMYGAGTNGDMVNMMLLRMFGNPFFDKKGNTCINDENGIKALQWIRDNYDEGCYPPGAENLDLMDCFELYRNRQLAIYFGNNVILGLMPEQGVDSRFVLYPSDSGRGKSFEFTYTFAVFDNGDEKRLEVSKDFIRFLYQDEELLGLSSVSGILPAFSSVARQHEDEIPMLSQWFSIQDTRVDFTGHSPNYPGIREVFYREIAAMLSGGQSPEETAARLDERMNAAIAQGREKGKLHE